ncbi:MAG TPA: DUF3352 domain-containing protein [Thermoleophilaceae bacterium]|nr:DUF3352 domain-containing protein [Thermoleophilaceae bacterium]
MRAFTATIATALALAGCGGGSGGADSPVDEALGHLPDDAALAIVLTTDLEGDQYEAAGDIVKRFPFGDQALDQLRGQLDSQGIDFDEDVRPLLGNEFVLGVADARDLAGDDPPFVGAVQTSDAGKLEELAQKDSKEIGEAEGAKLYQSDDTVLAVKDDVAVFGDTREVVEEALEQRGKDDRLREEDVEEALDGLPEERLGAVYVNVEELLGADPRSALARRIPWVGALRTAGATLAVEDKSVAFDIAVNTEDVEAEDLPFAAGPESPGVSAAEGEIGVGVRDPGQIVRFAEAAGQAVNPTGFAQYAQGKQLLEKQLDIDIDRDLVGQLAGDTSVAFDIGGDFGLRAELSDPAAFEGVLEKLAPAIPGFAEGAGLGSVGVSRPRGGEDFYAIAQAGGGSVVFGVVDRVLVASNDPQRAATLAGEQPGPVPGTRGSVVAGADAEQVANRFLSGLGGAEALGASLFTGALGQATGSIVTSGDGLRARFALAFE